MTLDELRDLVSRISYKPNWTIALLDGPEFPTLRIAWRSPDSTLRSPEPLDLRIKHTVPPLLCARWGPDEALRFVFEKVMEMERHEAREWFKVDGVPVDYPHAPGPRGELLP